MTELILMLIASVLCLIGLTEIIYKLKIKLFSPEIELKSQIFIYLEGENLSGQFFSFLERCVRFKNMELVAVYRGKNFDECEVLERIAENYNVKFIRE